LGMGEKKTPKSFISACNKFIYIEILQRETISTTETISKPVKSPKKKNKAEDKKVEDEITTLRKMIAESISDLAEEDGWVFLGVLGNLILKKQPDFDSRNYG